MIVNLTCPTSWQQLSQEQLRTVLDLMAAHSDPTVVKTLLLVRLCGLKVERRTRHGWRCQVRVDGKRRIVYLPTWQVQSFIGQLGFIDQVEDMDCRLDAVCGLHAADPLLHGVSFRDYTMAEKYWQMFSSTREMEWMDNVAMWLYRGGNGLAAGTGNATDSSGLKVEEMTLTPGERLGTMLWYMHVKKVMADNFSHFFQKTTADDGEEPDRLSGRDIQRMYDLQLRALTGGDPTKEAAVLALDCWRALTELDAKAREAEELERIRKKK